jgi:hypothetical protein
VRRLLPPVPPSASEPPVTRADLLIVKSDGLLEAVGRARVETDRKHVALADAGANIPRNDRGLTAWRGYGAIAVNALWSLLDAIIFGIALGDTDCLGYGRRSRAPILKTDFKSASAGGLQYDNVFHVFSACFSDTLAVKISVASERTELVDQYGLSDRAEAGSAAAPDTGRRNCLNETPFDVGAAAVLLQVDLCKGFYRHAATRACASCEVDRRHGNQAWVIGGNATRSADAIRAADQCAVLTGVGSSGGGLARTQSGSEALPQWSAIAFVAGRGTDVCTDRKIARLAVLYRPSALAPFPWPRSTQSQLPGARPPTNFEPKRGHLTRIQIDRGARAVALDTDREKSAGDGSHGIDRRRCLCGDGGGIEPDHLAEAIGNRALDSHRNLGVGDVGENYTVREAPGCVASHGQMLA